MDGPEVRIALHVKPRARVDAVLGLDPDGRWRIGVRAPPVEGAANEAVVRLLSRSVLGVPSRDVRVVAGSTSTMKTVQIIGLTPDEVVRCLESACGPTQKR